jgi:uncharacterized repeat protein (TIGR01451 family)
VPLQPQLTIEKTTTATQIDPGGQVPFDFAVTNGSAAAASNVVVTDTLPAGLTFASSAGCSSGDGVTIVCALGTVAAGETVTVSVVTVAADPFPGTAVGADGTVPNTASVSSPDTNCPAGATPPAAGCSSTIAVPIQPHVAVEKDDDGTAIVPGSLVPYVITVTNTEPVPVPEVTLVDVLPAGLTLVSTDNPACTSEDGVTLTCALGDLAVGATVTINVVTQAASPFPADALDAGGGVPNTASVTSPGSNCPVDGPGAPECSSTVTVPLQAQVTISKRSSVTGIVPGAEVPYLVTVTNTTPVEATEVTITDTLPVGLTFVSADNATCTSADNLTYTCALGTLSPGESIPINVTTQAASPFPSSAIDSAGSVPNTASVTSPDTNCPPGAAEPAPPCESTAIVPVQPQIVIEKTSSATGIAPGALVPYTITVTHTGTAPLPAIGLDVLDVLPVGLTFVSSPDNCTSADTVTIVCQLGDLAVGASVTVSVVTQAADPFPADAIDDSGRLPNTATVGSPGSNCPVGVIVLPDECQATETVPVEPQLSIVKTSPDAGLAPGGQVSYSIAVTNTSVVDASAVTVTDVLPAGLTFVSSPDCTAAADDITVTCAIGAIAAGGSATVTLVAQAADPFPADDLTPAGTLPNTASVTSPGTNCPPGAVTPAAACSSTAEVPLQSEVTISKASSAAQIVPGGQVPYAITVSNPGPVAATGVTVTDTLPVGLTFVSSDSGCTSGDGVTFSCVIGTVPAGGAVVVNVVAAAANPFPIDDVDVAGRVPNTATVTAPGSNCLPGVAEPAEECSSTVAVPLQPLLTIEKTSSAAQIVPGEQVPYTITVTNSTPVPAAGVTVTDVLPAGLTFLTAVDATCSAPDGVTVTCDLGDLPADSSVSFSLVTTAANPFPGTAVNATGGVPNTASVTAPATNCPAGATPPAAECSATAIVPVQPQIAIDKTSTATLVVPGGQVPYTFAVTNPGPVPATGVTVTDTLPAGLTFVSADPAVCTSAGSTITCTLATVAAGTTETIDIVDGGSQPVPARRRRRGRGAREHGLGDLAGDQLPAGRGRPGDRVQLDGDRVGGPPAPDREGVDLHRGRARRAGVLLVHRDQRDAGHGARRDHHRHAAGRADLPVFSRRLHLHRRDGDHLQPRGPGGRHDRDEKRGRPGGRPVPGRRDRRGGHGPQHGLGHRPGDELPAAGARGRSGVLVDGQPAGAAPDLDREVDDGSRHSAGWDRPPSRSPSPTRHRWRPRA